VAAQEGAADVEKEGAEASGTATLRFATARIGCLLPLVAGAACFLGYVAITPGFAADHGRLGALVRATQPLSLGPVNVGMTLLALSMVYGFVRMGMQWSDGEAVRAAADGLTFHWTLLPRRKVPWSEVRGAALGPSRATWTNVPEVSIVLTRGVVGIRGFDDEGGAADRFVRFVNARVGGAPPT
jgi:hypothetical protein